MKALMMDCLKLIECSQLLYLFIVGGDKNVILL